jgi:hypothetical protein
MKWVFSASITRQRRPAGSQLTPSARPKCLGFMESFFEHLKWFIRSHFVNKIIPWWIDRSFKLSTLRGIPTGRDGSAVSFRGATLKHANVFEETLYFI